MDVLRAFEEEQTAKTDRPRLRTGDIVRVETKVTEGEKERLQSFEGTILGIRGSGPSVTFTVRREVGRFAVERIFPLYSPLITGIDIVKRQKVRRAKLNYLREAGRRRVKEDELSMQRHRQEEMDKERLAEAAQKKAEDEKRAAEEAAAKADEEKKEEAKPADDAPAEEVEAKTTEEKSDEAQK